MFELCYMALVLMRRIGVYKYCSKIITPFFLFPGRTKPKALAYDSSTNRLAPFTGLTLTLVVIGCLAM